MFARLKDIKSQDGKNIAITGSPTLVRSLLPVGLLDELHLMVHPLVLGEGKRLFTERTARTDLELTESKTFGNGVLNLIYRPTGT